MSGCGDGSCRLDAAHRAAVTNAPPRSKSASAQRSSSSIDTAPIRVISSAPAVPPATRPRLATAVAMLMRSSGPFTDQGTKSGSGLRAPVVRVVTSHAADGGRGIGRRSTRSCASDLTLMWGVLPWGAPPPPGLRGSSARFPFGVDR